MRCSSGVRSASCKILQAAWNAYLEKLEAAADLSIGSYRDLVTALDPDVICLQETKVPDDLFPGHGPEALGFPYVARRGNPADAMAAIQARGTAFKPVWTRAYTALTGLHYDLNNGQIRGAFEGVLGPRTVGEQ